MKATNRPILLFALAALGGFQISRGQTGEPVVMLFAGDLMLGGHAERVSAGDTGYVFRHWRAGSQADLFVANVEHPVTVREGSREKEFTFKMSPLHLGTMLDGGLDIAVAANNHIADFGREGILETIDALARAGIRHVGIGRTLAEARQPVIASVKGKRIAVLAYYGKGEYAATDTSAGFAPRVQPWIVEDVRRADSAADYVVVSFHWGIEKAEFPEPWQVALGHAVIRAGADLVVGHHPHVLQGIERYKGGLIAYSLGNFVFGGHGRRADTTAVLKIVLQGESVKAELVPLLVRNYQVRLASRQLRDGVLDLVRRRSQQFEHSLFDNIGGLP